MDRPIKPGERIPERLVVGRKPAVAWAFLLLTLAILLVFWVNYAAVPSKSPFLFWFFTALVIRNIFLTARSNPPRRFTIDFSTRTYEDAWGWFKTQTVAGSLDDFEGLELYPTFTGRDVILVSKLKKRNSPPIGQGGERPERQNGLLRQFSEATGLNILSAP
ncbi:hypothetical protein EON79_09055 [bacterium]|nr:MAG: hypothetical protein EON79_09055 [bacterium]